MMRPVRSHRKFGYQSIQDATGITVLWYTVETFYLRREVVRQTEIEIQPLLLTLVERVPVWHEDHQEERLVVRNIGRGPALAVHIDTSALAKTVLGEAGTYLLPLDLIQPGQIGVPSIDLEPKGQQQNPWQYYSEFAKTLRERSATDDYTLIITYEDIARRRFESVVQIGKSGVHLTRHRQLARGGRVKRRGQQ